MAVIAAHPGAVHFAATDIAGAATGIKSYELSTSGELIDTTNLADTTGYHQRIQGLKDLTVTISGDFNTDTAQALIRSSAKSGATGYVRIFPDGSTGFKCAVKVSDYKVTADVSGLVTFSATFQATGLITAV
jgi:predicted secreted protein